MDRGEGTPLRAAAGGVGFSVVFAAIATMSEVVVMAVAGVLVGGTVPVT